MIDRYSLPEMTKIWTDEHKLICWVRVEFAALCAMMEVGIIPHFKLPTSLKDDDVSISALMKSWVTEEEKTHHDVVAFIHVMEKLLGENGKWLHYGMTSSDLCDTEFALRIKESMGMIKVSIGQLKFDIGTKANKYRMSPIIGRTHGMHAEPTTFGLVLLTYVDELGRHLDRFNEVYGRICVGKISGAVGTYAHLSPDVERRTLQSLDLDGEKVSSQIVHRDRHAELFNFLALVGGTIERLAVEIRHLSRSEIKEVAEPFGENQKGSSAMPHKKNPIKCENLTGLARLLRGYAGTAMENISLWHQRDISHSSVERVIAPDSFCVLYFMLERMREVINGLIVDHDKMNLRVFESSHSWRSQTEMLKLIKSGKSRKEAHDQMQDQQLAPCDQYSLIDHHLRYVDEIFSRCGL